MIGHLEAIGRLELSLPPVTLIRGPKSVGKRTLAEYVLAQRGALVADTRVVQKLDIDASRELKVFMSTSPFGPMKAAIVRLDGASESSLNALLKVLEEPPPRAHFFLTSTSASLPTVESRSMVLNVGLLSDDDLLRILVSKGMSDVAAKQAAARSKGTVETAMEPPLPEEARASVLSVLKAIADLDREKLDAALTHWSEDAHKLLKIWLVESLTQRWRLFSLTDTFGLASDRELCTQMLRDMSRTARPKLVARHALTSALRRKEV